MPSTVFFHGCAVRQNPGIATLSTLNRQENPTMSADQVTHALMSQQVNREFTPAQLVRLGQLRPDLLAQLAAMGADEAARARAMGLNSVYSPPQPYTLGVVQNVLAEDARRHPSASACGCQETPTRSAGTGYTVPKPYDLALGRKVGG
jgi:hypothetical protein